MIGWQNLRSTVPHVSSRGRTWIIIFLSLVTVAEASDFTTKHETPVSNASACGDCHQAPQLGGSSPTTVRRIGHLKEGRYVPGPNGGLAHSRSAGQASTFIPSAENVRGLRVSLNLLGDGYVEAVPDEVLRAIATEQRRATKGVIHGQPVAARVMEAGENVWRVGRFGWKSQHATVLSASADAFANELGIPNFLYPEPLVAESANDFGKRDLKHKPMETTGHVMEAAGANAELRELVRFVRSTEPVAPDADRAGGLAAKEGARLFEKLGCEICHLGSLKTAPVGARNAWIKGSGYQIPEELEGKIIHPYSDYLLHDIGTGDGIVQTAKPSKTDLRAEVQGTANKFRTAPLWGVRFRTWMMHDGQSKTYENAIKRHGGEARRITEKYEHLPVADRENLRTFLDSL